MMTPRPALSSRVIGIAGGSGSGKTTLAQQLKDHLGARATVISHDWYYHDCAHLSEEDRLRRNFDHPEAFETARLREDLAALCRGESFQAPRYCYATHRRFPDGGTVEPAEFIILEGLLVLHEPSLRELCTLTVFIDVPEAERLARRLRRDAAGRGIDPAETQRLFATFVRPMHERFIQPSAQYATHVWEPTLDPDFPARLGPQVTALLP